MDLLRTVPQAHRGFASDATAEVVQLTVDGRAVEGRDGEWLATLLDRLDQADGQRTATEGGPGGHSVPHVCFQPELGPIQTCDTCFVEVDGTLARACATPVRAGLVVATRTAASGDAREEGMHRLLGNHNLYCTVCDRNNGDCPVHNATKHVAVEHQRYPFERKPYETDASHPFYQYDPDQCIVCGKCVEACQEVQVTETLSIDWEADVPRVQWDGGALAGESSCVSCGHCVTVCPCNALMEKTMIGEAGHFTNLQSNVFYPSVDVVKAVEPFIGNSPIFALSDAEAAMREASIDKTKTVCTYCGVGCSFEVWTRERRILKIEPTGEGPANGISTCVKGKFGWDYVNAPERLRGPLVRVPDGQGGETFAEATWDHALETVATRMRAIVDAHGPDSVAFIASSKATNEESYLVQKLARAVFKTNNVDNCSRYCQAPATVGLWRTVGYGGDAGTMDDIRAADLVLMVGTNTDQSHPVLAAHLRAAQKQNGQTHIVADIRAHLTAQRADVFIRPTPGTDLIWMSAVAKYIFDQGWEDRAFLDQHVNHEASYRESLEPFTLAYAEQMTGIAQDTLIDIARRIAEAETVCGLWAMGVTQHKMGSDTSTALSNLLLVTGNFGKPGTGGYPLRGHNNVQGCSDFGSINTFFPGYQPVDDPEVRATYEAAWGVPLSATKGLDNREMIDAIHEGTLKAVFLVGEEIALVDANAHYVQEALAKLDLFVVQDIFFSKSAQFADVVLAASPSLEKDGTFTNTERRIQRLYQAIPPLADSRPDWRILTDLARHCGHDWGYTHPGEIMDEVAATTPLFAGVTYARLAGYRSLCWPVDADGTDTPLLYTDGFHLPDGKARLYPLGWTEPSEAPDEQYPLHLNTGRNLEHFHVGNQTHKSAGLNAIVPDTYVEVSHDLARERGVATGDWVRLASRRGKVEVQVLVSDQVRDGELYMPLSSAAHAVNYLTSNHVDPDSHTPAYKELAVQMEVLDGPPRGERRKRPIAATHHRYGSPTPQNGVEVERKWARPDYDLPVLQRPPVGYRRDAG
ncbi:formate dehydrogenase subunit alpha [Rubrivirga sp. SAORIC476]|uniref:formate dehydrogenase subunit alpha n=1 Tax=Rubrivirga sp. SAORIC476 TaxID=1961794 RepID=UPI000BA989C9|nr:formate dehydrogenase subunit alpha [Rubrivirga sp. SAORIC476]